LILYQTKKSFRTTGFKKFYKLLHSYGDFNAKHTSWINNDNNERGTTFKNWIHNDIDYKIKLYHTDKPQTYLVYRFGSYRSQIKN